MVDFLLEDTIILEADGYYGHLHKRDRRRDDDLLLYGDGTFERIVHIKGQERDDIMEELIEKLYARDC